MDTWTYMTELHLPVAPGSYRFRKGFASKQKRKNENTFNLACIRSGVKAPLLSDLSHRAKIRYGLDVVMQKTPPPPEYIHHEDYVPPPTAEPQNRGKDSSFRKYKFAGGTVRGSLDFKKLQPYAWVNTNDQEKGVPKAPDLLYRNTFGENSQEESNLLSPRPQVRGFSDPDSSRSPSPRRASVSQPPSARLRSPPKTPRVPSRPASEGSSRPVSRQPRQLSGRRLLKSLDDSKHIKLNVKPLSANSERDQREALNGSSGCLFSQVQDSIQFVKTIERGESVDVPRLVRPLHSERGRYRPHSTVKIATPRVRSPVANEHRNNKSAEAYIRILANANRPNPSSDLKQSHIYIESPSMSEIINQYMTPHERYNTPSSALHRVPDVNGPMSRSSTRQSVRFEKIPDWARAETEQGREYESEIDTVSRAESTMERARGERATEVPAVHIKYSDKMAPLSMDTPKTQQNTERDNEPDS